MNDVLIKILKINSLVDSDIPLPQYMTPYSSGMDICAVIKDKINLFPGEIKLINTGFAIELPIGYEAQIRPRSGLAIKNGISILNSPGTIDSDYRGEIKVILINFGKNVFVVKRGNRIAQMVITNVFYANFNIVEKLENSKRDSNGFGHTGLI